MTFSERVETELLFCDECGRDAEWQRSDRRTFCGRHGGPFWDVSDEHKETPA